MPAGDAAAVQQREARSGGPQGGGHLGAQGVGDRGANRPVWHGQTGRLTVVVDRRAAASTPPSACEDPREPDEIQDTADAAAG